SHDPLLFDYLRQALMCAADSTLETVDPASLATDGWNVVHRCRNCEALFHWAEANTESKAVGI
ncbi:hypothetical protein B0J12DRAFT_554479, partial [Macrophomina phaseolina]